MLATGDVATLSLAAAAALLLAIGDATSLAADAALLLATGDVATRSLAAAAALLLATSEVIPLDEDAALLLTTGDVATLSFAAPRRCCWPPAKPRRSPRTPRCCWPPASRNAVARRGRRAAAGH